MAIAQRLRPCDCASPARPVPTRRDARAARRSDTMARKRLARYIMHKYTRRIPNPHAKSHSCAVVLIAMHCHSA
eukprot:6213353-Pleurochrysis_carterae.AAC.2